MRPVINLRPRTIKQKKESLINPQNCNNQIRLIPAQPSNIQTPVKTSQISQGSRKNVAIYLTLTQRKSLNKSNEHGSELIKSLRKIKSIKQIEPLHKDKISLTSSNRLKVASRLQSPIKPQEVNKQTKNEKIPINISALKERAIDNSNKKANIQHKKHQHLTISKTIKNSIIHYPQT